MLGSSAVTVTQVLPTYFLAYLHTRKINEGELPRRLYVGYKSLISPYKSVISPVAPLAMVVFLNAISSSGMEN